MVEIKTEIRAQKVYKTSLDSCKLDTIFDHEGQWIVQNNFFKNYD